MPKYTIMTETVFTLFDETTPEEAVATVESNIQPLRTEPWLKIDRAEYTAGTCDEDGNFQPVTIDDDTVAEYCVKVEFYLDPVESDTLEELLEHTEIGGGIQEFPNLEEEIGEIVSDEVRVFNNDGELVY
jgi:hypothetical protein